MGHLRKLLRATFTITSAAVLAACSTMQPKVAETFSKTQPKFIVPMAILPLDYPLIAWDHHALPSSVTACFRVYRNGHAHDVTITHASIPETGDKKLDHKIRAALGAYVRDSIRDSQFYPDKVNGKRVDSPRACQDFGFSRLKSYMLHTSSFRFIPQQTYILKTGTWMISRPRPKDIVPMVRVAPLVPHIVLANNAAPSSVTACFKVEGNGQTRDVTITRISIPHSNDNNLNRKIEVALGAAVLGAVKQSLFFPEKVKGKPVESTSVCEDYTLHSLR